MDKKNAAYIIFFFLSSLIGRWMSYISQTMILSWMTVFLLCLWWWYAWVSWKVWWRQWVIWFVSLGIFALCIEYIGSTTCFPYGCFEYSSTLGIHLWPIPLLLILIRPIMVLSMVSVASVFTQKKIAWWILSVVFLIILDLALDPVHVSQGIWTYAEAQGRYGVPLTNYLGWIFSGTISVCLLFSIIDIKKPSIPLAFIMGWWCLLGYFWGLFLVSVVM